MPVALRTTGEKEFNVKSIKVVVASALLGSSILSTPAIGGVTLTSSVPTADPAGLTADNLNAAQLQCDLAAAALDADGASADSDIYTAEVAEGAVTLVAGPTEIGSEGTRNIDLSTRVGAGTFTPAHLEIVGDPYRNGGSVNMFGIQRSVGGRYSNSAYDFTADFKTTYAVAYSCNVAMAKYNPPVHHPAVYHPREGYWLVNPDRNGKEEGVTNNCEAFNTALPEGPANGHPTDQANCRYTETQAAYTEEAYTDPATWDAPVPVAVVAGASFNQDQTDNLSAREDLGSGFDTSETLTIGQVVVCISPSKTGTKLPGAWTAKNGYTGSKCTTAWYSGTAPYSLSDYAGTNVPNLNDGSHNLVTVPVM